MSAANWAAAELKSWHRELDQSQLEAEGLEIVAQLVTAQLDIEAAAVADSLHRLISRKRQGVFSAIDIVLDSVNGIGYTAETQEAFNQTADEVESAQQDYMLSVIEASQALEAAALTAE